MINRLTNSLAKNLRIVQSHTKSSTKSPINEPPAIYLNNRQALKQNIWRDVDPTHKKSQITHLSNAQQLIHQIPVIKAHTDVVRCMGGTIPGSGHPMVYIQLNTKNPGEAVPCKYCGLRYALDDHHHH